MEGEEDEEVVYYYIREGETLQSEIYPGRRYSSKTELKRKDRFAEVQWGDQRALIDESFFDSMLLERLTSSVFLGSGLKNSFQFQQIMKEGVSYVFHLRTVS